MEAVHRERGYHAGHRAAPRRRSLAVVAAPLEPAPIAAFTANTRAFTVLVRNELFRVVTELAHHREGELADDMAAYWAEHDHIHIDADARSAQWFEVDLDTGLATQTICDPAGFNEWVLDAEIDLEASDAEERAVVIPVSVRRR